MDTIATVTAPTAPEDLGPELEVLVFTPYEARTFEGPEALAAARLFVELGVPDLKKGWTANWEPIGPGRFMMRVRNSKGRVVSAAAMSIKEATA